MIVKINNYEIILDDNVNKLGLNNAIELATQWLKEKRKEFDYKNEV